MAKVLSALSPPGTADVLHATAGLLARYRAEMVEWRVHGERRIYESPWVNLALTTVEPPGVEPFEHHVVRAANPAAGCVITRTVAREQEILLLFRHRFITDTWGWEIPAGGVDTDEAPVDAAVREAVEETGWKPTGTVEPVITYHPSNGLSDQTFHIFHADGADQVGEPTDATEASRIEWRTTSDVRELIANGEIGDGLSVTALAVSFTLGVLHC